jgi:glycosyltransferase involved in cell wall biosynthesis
MRILFITPYIPNRIRVRPYQWLRALVQRGHELTLLAVWTVPEELADIEALREIGVRVVAHQLPQWRSLANAAGALFSNLPLQAVYSIEPHLMRSLEVVLAEEQLDVVHVEHLRGAQYGLYARNSAIAAQGKRPAPVVWDSVDCISHLFQQAAQHSRSMRGRMMTRLDLPRTQRYEGKLVRQFDHVLVTSPADKAALIDLARRSERPPSQLDDGEPCRQVDEKLSVLPNGVDLEYFTPTSKADACAAGPTQFASPRIVFSGKMSYHANITAAHHLVHEIMPPVWAQRPDAEIWIVGKDPTPEVCALANDGVKSSNGQMAPQGRVVVTGSVPDIRPYLHQAAVAVAPIVYGAGIQNKVLEAMACGRPVIASTQAASALAVENGRELLIAGDSASFAQAITFLLDDPQRREELAHKGRAYVEQKHSWQRASAQLEEIYEGAIASHRIMV